MQLLRCSGITLLGPLVALSLGCRPVTIIQDDDDGVTPSSTGMVVTTNPPPDTGEDETTEEPAEDTTGTSTGGASTGSGSSDDGPSCNVGQACGNGCIEGTEQCDCGGEFCSPAGLGGNMCAGLVNPLFPDRVYTGGILDCNPASCQFNFSQCTFCGDTVLNGNEVCELDDDPGPSCQALGEGPSTTPLPCGNDCQWDTTCCEVPLPKECM